MGSLHYRPCLILLCLLGLLPAGAEPVPPADPNATTPETLATENPLAVDLPQEERITPLFSTPSFTGSATATFDQYFESSRADQNGDYFYETVLDLNVTGQVGEHVLYVLTPRLQYHSGNLVDMRFEFLEQNEQRPVFTFQEAYVEFSHEGFSASVGKHLFSWGVADAYKPTDVINPSDSLIIPDSYKIGVPSTALRYAGGWGSMEAVIVPWFTPARSPEPTDRWFPDDSETRRRLQEALGFVPPIVYPPRELPGNAIENIQAGMRLQSSSLLQGWDLALNYFRGFQPNGIYRGGVAPGPALGLTRTYPEFHMVGGSFSTTWQDFEFHGETAYHHTVEDAQDENYISYIAGLNYNWTQSLPSFLDRATLVLEYAGEQVTRERPAGSNFVSSGIDRGLTNSVVTKARFEFLQETRFEISGAYNFNGSDYAVGFSLARKFFDRLDARIGADFLWGDNDTFFGAWAQNDRVYSSLTLNF
jgi:hypothetical protein